MRIRSLVLSFVVIASFGCVAVPSTTTPAPTTTTRRLVPGAHPAYPLGATMLVPMLLGQVPADWITIAHKVWGDQVTVDVSGQPVVVDRYEIGITLATVDLRDGVGVPLKTISATPAEYTAKLSAAPLLVGAAKDSRYRVYSRAHRAGHPATLFGPWSSPWEGEFQTPPPAAPPTPRVTIEFTISGTATITGGTP